MNPAQLTVALEFLADLLDGTRGPRQLHSKIERYELRAYCLDCRAGVSVPVEVYLPAQSLTAADKLKGERFDAEHRQIREHMEAAARAQVARGLEAHRERGHRLSEVQRVELPA